MSALYACRKHNAYLDPHPYTYPDGSQVRECLSPTLHFVHDDDWEPATPGLDGLVYCGHCRESLPYRDRDPGGSLCAVCGEWTTPWGEWSEPSTHPETL